MQFSFNLIFLFFNVLDHNRLPSSKSLKDKEKDSNSTRPSHRRREENEKVPTEAPSKDSSSSLREQISRLREQFDALQTETGKKDDEIIRLTSLSDQFRAQVTAELTECGKKLETMAIIVQNGELKVRLNFKKCGGKRTTRF